MKHNPLKRSVALSAVVGLACLGLMLAGTLAPMAILPKLDLTMMLALSVTALAVDAYWSPERKLSWPALAANTVLGGAAFALLPDRKSVV